MFTVYFIFAGCEEAVRCIGRRLGLLPPSVQTSGLVLEAAEKSLGSLQPDYPGANHAADPPGLTMVVPGLPSVPGQ